MSPERKRTGSQSIVRAPITHLLDDPFYILTFYVFCASVLSLGAIAVSRRGYAPSSILRGGTAAVIPIAYVFFALTTLVKTSVKRLVRFFISSFLAVVGQAVTAKHAARLVRTALLFSAVTAVSAFTGLAAVATSWSSLAYSRAAAHGGPSAGFYLLMLVLQATVLIALGCIPLAYHWISSILLSRGAIPSIVKRYRSQALEFGYSVLEREAESRDIRVERVREGSGVLQVNPATAASGQ